MAQPNRDPDPPLAQVKVLLLRSGGHCAYTGCERELVLDALDASQPSKSVGRIGHIRAASPLGPRYDASMTREERGAANNLIYLCGDHHDLIDFDVAGHPAEALYLMKSTHEAAMRRAVRAASGNISYQTLSLVCSVVAAQIPEGAAEVELSLPTQEKLQLNNLSEPVAQQVELGLSQAFRVQQFVDFQSSQVSNFERRLVARVRSDYEEAIADGLVADEAFEYVLAKSIDNAGPIDTPEVRAAALAVVALMFEICEIFEHE